MHEAAYDGRREPRPPHTAEVAECRDINCAQLGYGRVNPSIECIQHSRNVRRSDRLAFRSKRRKLVVGQGAAPRVREEAIDDPHNVPHMKCWRRHSPGPGVPLGFAQVLDKLADTFTNL